MFRYHQSGACAAANSIVHGMYVFSGVARPLGRAPALGATRPTAAASPLPCHPLGGAWDAKHVPMECTGVCRRRKRDRGCGSVRHARSLAFNLWKSITRRDRITGTGYGFLLTGAAVLAGSTARSPDRSMRPKGAVSWPARLRPGCAGDKPRRYGQTAVAPGFMPGKKRAERVCHGRSCPAVFLRAPPTA